MNSHGYDFIPCPTPDHGGINVAHRPSYRCGYVLPEAAHQTMDLALNVENEPLHEGQTCLFAEPQEALW